MGGVSKTFGSVIEDVLFKRDADASGQMCVSKALLHYLVIASIEMR